MLFPPAPAFEVWKSTTEEQEKCNYVQQQGKKAKDDSINGTKERTHYVCNRTCSLGKLGLSTIYIAVPFFLRT